MDLLGLDAGGVFLFKGGEWVRTTLQVALRRALPAGENRPWQPSSRVLNELLKVKKTARRPRSAEEKDEEAMLRDKRPRDDRRTSQRGRPGTDGE